MKIEIGESVMYTWLRHVKGCRMAQTNWKASPKWEYDEESLTTVKTLAAEVQKHFAARNWVIFKNDQNIEQVIKQTESDVMGIAWHGNEPVYYAVESAFHEDGLNYGSKEVTCAKVISKLTRTAIAMCLYMPKAHCEIVFASPKVNNNIMEPLLQALDELKEILFRNSVDCSVYIYANADFQERILTPVMNILDENIADTSELFVRSMQLVKMFSSPRNILNATLKNGPTQVTTTSGQNGEDILRPRYNTRKRNNIVCAYKKAANNSSVCWMNINKKKLDNPDLDNSNFYFYCILDGVEYIYSIPVVNLRNWIVAHCKIITKGTCRYSFFINYRKGSLTPDVAENGSSLQLRVSEMI